MFGNDLLRNEKKEPKYSNYYTWFRYYQNLKEEPDYKNLFQEFDNAIGVRVCFSNLFRVFRKLSEKETKASVDTKEKSIIVDTVDANKTETLLVGIRLYNFKPSDNNYCIISPDYVKYWCEAFKDSVDYNIEVLFNNPENPDRCIVRIDRKKVSPCGNVERLLLTWIRYLYEYPYNYCTIDTLRLKQLDRFKDYSLFDLYSVVSHCYFQTSWGTGHSIVKGGGIFPKKYMEKYFKSTRLQEVNDFGKSFRSNTNMCSGVLKFGTTMLDLLDDSKFEQLRLETYIKVIDKFDEILKTKIEEDEQ